MLPPGTPTLPTATVLPSGTPTPPLGASPSALACVRGAQARSHPRLPPPPPAQEMQGDAKVVLPALDHTPSCLPRWLRANTSLMIPPVSALPVRGGDVIIGENTPVK